VEATALPASVGLGRSRVVIGASLLRIRSDEQLVTLFRAGHDDAFRVIHDRYRPRLYAYTRQMLNGTGQDPEDAVQEIFMRAYYGLRANQRELALRAWLYRIAHNRCVDELRRPHPIAVEVIDGMVTTLQDPVIKAEQRDALRRLIADVQRLPEQQRSALLMRELSGMPYNDVADAIGVSVSAVKSLLVRARVSLAQASEARDTACTEIREDLIDAHDRGVRTSGLARRHMRDCHDCREFRTQVRGVTHGLAALTPTLGPLGVIANLLGWGSGASGSAVASGAAGGGAAAAGGAAGGGAAASAGLLAGGTHVVTLLAAAVVTAGGAVELQNSLASPPAHRAHHRVAAVAPAAARRSAHRTAVKSASTVTTRHAAKHAVKTHAAAGATNRRAAGTTAAAKHSSTAAQATNASAATTSSRQIIPITETLDPDNLVYPTNAAPTGVPESDNTTADSSTSAPGTVTSSGSPASTQNAGATTTTSGTPIATSTGSPSTTTTGTGSESGTATGTPADTGTGTGTGSNTATSTGTVTPSTTPTATGTSDDTSSTSTAGTQTSATSVGTTTTRASKGKAIRLISKRHHRHSRRVVGGLVSSIG
jgi:RNA polymerase sigma factor (sigma-70 family)